MILDNIETTSSILVSLPSFVNLQIMGVVRSPLLIWWIPILLWESHRLLISTNRIRLFRLLFISLSVDNQINIYMVVVRQSFDRRLILQRIPTLTGRPAY